MDRIGVVVHPRRELDNALRELREWASDQDAEVVQVRTPGQDREVAPAGEPGDCDLVLALGGDGTTLAALHAAAPADRPVLGIACGSLGALTSVGVDDLDSALDRIATGRWSRRVLPALSLSGGTRHALNDIVIVRAGAGQIALEVEVDGQRFIRFAGDGIIACTPFGSTAYTLASGGPMLAPGSDGFVLTPLAPHGGVCPPLVGTPGTEVRMTVHPGYGGARIEVDGQVRGTLGPLDPVDLAIGYEEQYATLVELGEQEPLIAGLRRRGILVDSPRMLIREQREGSKI